MSSKLYSAGLVAGLVLLSACSLTPQDLVRTREIKCPPAPVVIQCELYEGFAGGTLREKLRYDEDARVSHNQCKKAVDLWEELWEECDGDT